jgi:hypothetical protein
MPSLTRQLTRALSPKERHNIQDKLQLILSYTEMNQPAKVIAVVHALAQLLRYNPATLRSFEKGGLVKKTGNYRLHKGETVHIAKKFTKLRRQ